MISWLNSLISNKGFIRYFKNTSWMFAEQILRLIAGILVGIWVARYLGPKQFGIYNYALAFTAIFSGIAKLGLDSILVRELVHDPSKRDIYLGTAFWLKASGAIVTFVAIALTTIITSDDATINFYIFIISSGMIFQSFEVIDFYFQSKVLSKFVSICKITQLFFSSLIKIYLVFSGADLFWFVIVSLFDQFTLGISLVIAYKIQNLGTFYRYFDTSVARKLLSDSWPLIFSGLVVMIYMRIDQIMIKNMLGDREVGIYSAAVRLSEVWYFIPMIITNSLFPAIISSKMISKSFYYARLQRLYTFMVWVAIGIAVPMTFLSDWLIVLFYGESYKEAGKILKIHIWAGVFVFLGVAFGRYLTAENLTSKSFYRTFCGAITNVVLNFIFIPIHGIYGAAIATLLAQFTANYLYDFFDKTLYQQLRLKTIAIVNPIGIFCTTKK